MSKNETELDHSWKQVQTAVWLIGLAILAWQGWWWPGILILVAISGLTEAAMRQVATKEKQAVDTEQKDADAAAMRAALVPDTCPNCGSPVTSESVQWSGPATATCPYCGSVVTERATEQANEPQ